MNKYCVNLCRSCIRQTQSLYSHHIEQQLQIDITINDVGLTATSAKMLFISGVQTGVNDETTWKTLVPMSVAMHTYNVLLL